MIEKIESHAPFLLKIALIVLAIPGVFAFGFIGYNVIRGLVEGGGVWYLYPPFIIFMVSCVPYVYALIPSYRLVEKIENNSFFDHQTLVELTRIMIAGGLIGLLFLIAMPFWYLVAQWDDAPGLIVIMGFIMGLAFIISLFAMTLKKVVVSGIKNDETKEGNDR